MAETAGIRLGGLEPGVTRWIRPTEDFGPGRIAAVEDPVGNYVQIVELAARPGAGR
jgi:hypothetical protein